jgi:transcriptional regulator with XRE-family HTH domain
MPSPLGNKIRAAREGKDYSLETLARLTGMSKGYLWELENRDNPNPSVEKVKKIALALEVPADYLTNDAPDSTPEEELRDQAFFRRYQDLDDKTKAKVRKFLEFWEGED